MPTLDIFNDDAFSLTSLSASVDNIPYVPGRIGRLGIHEEAGVATTTVMVESRDGTLALVPDTPRGAPAVQNKSEIRKMRVFKVPHLVVEDSIRADEIQNLRAFGSESETEMVQAVVNQRLRRMKSNLDATTEYGKLGSVKGIIYDSDGSTVLYNLFTEFGVSQDTTDLLLGTTTTDLIDKATEVAGYIEDALGAGVYDHIHAVLGKTLWQRFISHTAVKDAYKFFQATGQNMNPLREDLRYAGFVFGGIVWEQYRGSVGGVDFVAATEGHAFPVGVPGLFVTNFAPADYMETVNTLGRPYYAKQSVDAKFQKFVDLEAQTNPLSLCTKPKTLIKLVTGN